MICQKLADNTKTLLTVKHSVNFWKIFSGSCLHGWWRPYLDHCCQQWSTQRCLPCRAKIVSQLFLYPLMSSSKAQRTGSTFVNPWTPGFSFRESAAAILKGPLTRCTPFPVQVDPVKTIKCDFEMSKSEEAHKSVCATWLGHAVSQLRNWRVC